MTEPGALLSARKLCVRYPLRLGMGRQLFAGGESRWLSAVRGVSFELRHGEVLGVVGESGCGKSSLVRALVGLVPVSSGSILWEGRPVSPRRRIDREYARAVQIVFQDPLSSLNPRMKVAECIAEPFEIHDRRLARSAVSKRIDEVLALVGLDTEHASRFPHELSGGQCQRVAIARALVLGPKVLICDESVSALDVSIQAQVLNLFMDLKDRLGLALLFVSHDLSVVRHLSDRVVVMQGGQFVEDGGAADVFERPQHAYTKMLLESIPMIQPSQSG